MFRILILAAATAFVFNATAAHAVDDAAKCAAAKQKAAAKKLSQKVKCHGKAIKKGIDVDAACLLKAETKFDTAFSKAEGKGGCATTADAGAIEALIDDTLEQLLSALPHATTTTTTTVPTPTTTLPQPCADQGGGVCGGSCPNSGTCVLDLVTFNCTCTPSECDRIEIAPFTGICVGNCGVSGGACGCSSSGVCGVAAACSVNLDCPLGMVCDPFSGICAGGACNVASDCPSGGFCFCNDCVCQ